VRGLAAVRAGPGARRVLQRRACGRVTVVGSAGAYAQLGDDHVHVCRVGAPFGPLSVLVTQPERLDLRPGVEVAAVPGELRIGSCEISLDRVRVRGLAAASAPGGPIDGRIVAAVLERLPALTRSLVAGVRALETGDLPAAVAALAGRGAGLTPDGDDVLAGYAAWRQATGNPVGLADAAAGLASPIGLSYLRCAERGELPDAAARLLTGLRAGDSDAALAALPALMRWGSSSGAALAHGLLAGARPQITRDEAEGEGFEPSVRLRAQRFSRSLRGDSELA
jgi:Protein of unknown function (DUF2877)